MLGLEPSRRHARLSEGPFSALQISPGPGPNVAKSGAYLAYVVSYIVSVLLSVRTFAAAAASLAAVLAFMILGMAMAAVNASMLRSNPRLVLTMWIAFSSP